MNISNTINEGAVFTVLSFNTIELDVVMTIEINGEKEYAVFQYDDLKHLAFEDGDGYSVELIDKNFKVIDGKLQYN